MSKHENGTVASITWNNAPFNKDAEMTTAVAVYDAEDGFWSMGRGTGLMDKQIVDLSADVRPLVVLDPEDRKQITRLVRACPEDWSFSTDDVTESDVTNHFQAALRSLVAPPRTCSASVNLSGEHFACIEPPEHGGPHRNPDAEAVWGEAS